MKRLVLLLGVLLVACGGGPPSPQGMRDAETSLRLARADFQRHRYDQAAASYGRALDAAWRLDEGRLIAAAGSERALALLRTGDAHAALQLTAEIERELDRRGVEPPVLLALTAAAAEIRLERFDDARSRLDTLDVGSPADPLIAGRRDYLLGRIAFEIGNRALLAQVIARLPDVEPAMLAADRLELEARTLLLDGRPVEALATLVEVEERRRDLDQLGAVGDTLALAGDAAVMAGEPLRAGDLFLRAARNAFALERLELARARLDRAAAQAMQTDDEALMSAIDALDRRLGDLDA